MPFESWQARSSISPALSEKLRMDEIWKDPEIGGIRDEYFDDFLGGLQTKPT